MVNSGKLGVKEINGVIMLFAFALALAAMLITASTISIANNSGSSTIIRNAYAQGNTWYVGKGVQPNTYYTYKIQEHDTANGQPFLMTIYFKQFNSAGGYWIAPSFVATPDGQVINGTLHLSDLDLSVLGGSQVPDSMQPYIAAYTSSIHWLASFASKGQQQGLSSAYWGKIASIGGSPIAPGGSSKVTVPGGTFDTVVITWHKGSDNNIYVAPNMPYPVKALTYADVTTGNPPIQYSFDLQATGKGQPPIPKSQVLMPKPPLTIQTARGTYYIQLLWDPQTIQVGKDTNFAVVFENGAQSIQPGVSYSFQVKDSSGKVISDVHDQQASDGTGKLPPVKFTKAGPADVHVSIDAVQGQPTGEFVEDAHFKVVAT
jgi:hypothetical protein